MKRSLIGLAVALSVSQAHAYSDAAMASAEGLSVFDRAYEESASRTATGAVKYHKTEPTGGAVLDLSLDEPVISVEETETERRYRQVLADLDDNRLMLEQARAEAERVVDTAHAKVVSQANERVRLLEGQRLTIEQQRASIEEQRASIQSQIAQVALQEQRVYEALELNDQAMVAAENLVVDGANQVAFIKQESQNILMMAESNAMAIESAAKQRVELERVDPTVVLNEPVAVEFHAATLEEIAAGLMPQGWRIQTDFSVRPELSDRQYQFISTDPRDLALRRLTASVRDAKVRFAYFWDLTDANGDPSPMLLITDKAN